MIRNCFVVGMMMTMSLSAAAGKSSDSTELVGFLDQFLTAFRQLDWEPFYNSFTEDATAFFPPSAKFPSRANNKEEIGKIFRMVFENARKRGGGPPYLVIEPKELKIQLVGETAIVSFLLEDPGMLGRRTLICRRTAKGWKIMHLHASGVVQP